MNVLLIGSSGSLMTSLITRLHKEGHRIFVLTGEKDTKVRFKHAFEVYRFGYENESVPEVFESVRPDVTLYLGAFDPGTKLKTDVDAVHYFSGVMSLLVSFSMRRSGRFVYLSTSEIFEKGSQELISETDKPNCDSPRALVLAQTEEICESYRRNLNLDVITLRMDPIYAIPKDRAGVKNELADLCLQAVENGKVQWQGGDEFSLLYEADAVEFIHRIMFCRSHREGLYNVSSSIGVTQEQLAGYIAESGMPDVKLSPRPGIGVRRVLSNKRFNEEFGMRFFSDPKKMVEKTLAVMKENPDAFKPQKAKRASLFSRLMERVGWFFRAALPYVENVICFIPFFMLNNRAVGSRYFDRLDFYLLYVLLFAVVYGQRQATFSAILATIGYCFRQMYNMSSFEVFSSYNTYVWLAQLFILGMVVGYMKDKLIEQQIESNEEQHYLSNRIDDIRDINKSNVRVKDSLQTQIINQNNSVGKVYEITSTLDQYMPEEVLFYAAEIMAKLMETKDIAVYTVSNSDYARLFSSTSEQARSMGRSIRYNECGAMSEALKNHQVFINRKLDQNLPMMANAIYENDQMQIIIMAWGIPWEAMTLGQANLMSIVSSLIQNAVLRAGRFMSALESQRYEKGLNVLNRDAFTSLLRAFLAARERGLTDCTVLRYAAGGDFSRSDEIRSTLRQSDYAGMLEDDALYLLLTNTDAKDAQIVLNRLDAKGYKAEIMEEFGL